MNPETKNDREFDWFEYIRINELPEQINEFAAFSEDERASLLAFYQDQALLKLADMYSRDPDGLELDETADPKVSYRTMSREQLKIISRVLQDGELEAMVYREPSAAEELKREIEMLTDKADRYINEPDPVVIGYEVSKRKLAEDIRNAVNTMHWQLHSSVKSEVERHHANVKNPSVADCNDLWEQLCTIACCALNASASLHQLNEAVRRDRDATVKSSKAPKKSTDRATWRKELNEIRDHRLKLAKDYLVQNPNASMSEVSRFVAGELGLTPETIRKYFVRQKSWDMSLDS